MFERLVDRLVVLFHLDAGNRFRKYGYFEGIASIVVNLLLSAFKLVFGLILNSVSLVADSLHSLSDVMTSAIVVFGFRVAAKPADAEHPFGHARAERIVAIVIACLLIVVGIEFLRSGFVRFRNPVPIRADAFILAMLAVSVLIKEFLFRLSRSMGRRINSAALKADAWHHRTDAVSTVLVLLGFVSFRFGLYSMDGIFGILVACIIIYTGIAMIKESGSVLIGEAPPSSLVDRIKETAANLNGVSDVHHIHVHDYGSQLEVTIHVRVKGDTHVEDAHNKACEVEQAIKSCVPEAEVTVHLEPLKKRGRRE
jgi:cation diffusion facilitator family transporter